MSNSLPKSTIQRHTQAYSKLLGTPYSEKDCWGIILDFYREVFGIQLKSYYDKIPGNRDITQNIIYSNAGDFTKIHEKDRRFGDIIVIRLYKVESHVAVYVGDDKMLHTTSHSGCVIDRVLRWKHLITGYYRVENNDPSS